MCNPIKQQSKPFTPHSSSRRSKHSKLWYLRSLMGVRLLLLTWVPINQSVLLAIRLMLRMLSLELLLVTDTISLTCGITLSPIRALVVSMAPRHLWATFQDSTVIHLIYLTTLNLYYFMDKITVTQLRNVCIGLPFLVLI